MTHEDKIRWMHEWCDRREFELKLDGVVGFGRECVGIVRHDQFPTYWDYEREDYENKPWRPPDAYHKHDCVAVLGRGEHAESQLYDWLKWFDDNGYVSKSKRASDNSMSRLFGGQSKTPWLVKEVAPVTESDKRAIRDYCAANADAYTWGGVLDVSVLAFEAAHMAEHEADVKAAQAFALTVCEELAEAKGEAP